MGREARATAALSAAERQARRLMRAAQTLWNEERLYRALVGLTIADQRTALAIMAPHLPFRLTAPQRRWLEHRWRWPASGPVDAPAQKGGAPV
jgi:hypothetical protein